MDLRTALTATSSVTADAAPTELGVERSGRWEGWMAPATVRVAEMAVDNERVRSAGAGAVTAPCA